MSKRMYNEDGQISEDGREAFKIAAVHIKAAIEALAEAGFNAREAGHALNDEVFVQSVSILGRQRRARSAPF